MRLIAVAVFLILASSGLTNAASRRDNPALSSPVTLAVKGEALSDIMTMLQEQTGVQLRVARDISDQKATIFVDDKPLRQVMEGLTTLFKYQWSRKTYRERKIYELWEDEKTRRERQDQWWNAYAAAWPELDAKIERIIELSTKPREEVRRLWDASKERGDPDREAIAALSRQWLAMARLYHGLPPEAKVALRDGMTVWCDSRSPEEEWIIPESIARDIAATLAPSGSDSCVQEYGPELVRAEFSVLDSLDQSRGIGVGGWVCTRCSVPDNRRVKKPANVVLGGWSNCSPINLPRKELADALPTPPTTLPHSGDDSVLDSKVTLSISDLVSEARGPQDANGDGCVSSAIPGPAAQIWVNRSDLLSLLHKKLGLQIISDHYSDWHSQPPVEDRSVRTLLEVSDRFPERSVFGQAVWGWDGSILYTRTNDIYGSDSTEIPNRVLRPWQSLYSQQGWLDVDTLAAMSLLEDQQVKKLLRVSHRIGLGDLNLRSYFLGLGPAHGGGLLALRLYGTLTPDQRKKALADGLNISSLTRQQRAALAPLVAMPAEDIGPPCFWRVVVGIYDRTGYRVDKPEARADGSPRILQIRTESEKYFEYRMGGAVKRVIAASTPDEALEKIRQLKTTGDQTSGKGALSEIERTKYTLGVVMSSGVEKKSEFFITKCMKCIPVKATY